MEAMRVTARPKIFYGWYIVGLAFFAQLMSGGLQTYTLGVFMKPMIDELGWTRGGISLVQTFGTVINGFLAPFIGGILDRRGGRALMIFGILVTGIGFMALSLMVEIWHFYAIRGLIITVGILCMGGLVVNVALSNWFIRKRGRAVAFAGMGVSFAGVFLAPLSQVLIDSFGWRYAWIILGAAVWLMFVPTALIMRRRPEDMGLLPDGDTAPPVGGATPRMGQSALGQEVRWTRAQAMRTSTLWFIIAAFGFSMMGQGAMMMHVAPFVNDLGFSPAAAALALSIQAGGSMLSKIVWGFLIERMQVRIVAMMAFVCAGTGIGLALLVGASSIQLLYLSLALFGIGMGGQIPIQEVVWANYYGRLTLGTIRSIGMPFMIISSAGGPFMAGATYDLTGSYQGAFLAFIGTYALAFVIMLFIRPPKHPEMAKAQAGTRV